ncbi:hypothetical protein T265_05481 [Opisthorchis viverrini]|uniref:Uncharacterized protein n=1 Tax=Opisthorchis viverrini TaxID=6198 RepID=A0A075AFA5_OPIVI|nr:hypothetical protein T265_05481 [Opisthorchis viverrini]KER27524.1 hypothetical protein T265_05481 [Opisthorchis viverrini]
MWACKRQTGWLRADRPWNAVTTVGVLAVSQPKYNYESHIGGAISQVVLLAAYINSATHLATEAVLSDTPVLTSCPVITKLQLV